MSRSDRSLSSQTRPWRFSLVAQVMALVVTTLVGAIIVHASIALLIPPPPPEIYRISEVAAAIRSPGRAVTARNGHVIEAKVEAADWKPGAMAEPVAPRVQHWLGRELATQLGLPEDAIRVILPVEPGGMGRRYVHAMRSQMPPPPGPPPGQLAQRPQGPPPGEGPPDDNFRSPHLGEGPHVAAAGRQSRGDPFIIAPFTMQAQGADQRWVTLSVRETGLFTDWRQRVLLGFALSVLVLGPIGFLFARWLAAPIAAFALAAERLGRDPGAPPLQVRGPSEVAVATAAFNQMQDRIRRYVQDRTAMIGSVAHDLRTPLTRMKFRIEQAPDELRDKLAADIDEMEAIISATLSFVRDASHVATRQRVDLDELVGRIISEMQETGIEASMIETTSVMIDGDPLGLRRVVVNLIQNASKFGKCARVRVSRDAINAIIDVEDEGPGVLESDRERVFEPFVRVEPSRNRQTGGAGLGLAVVRTVARAHGGDASLINMDGGGLRARILLPLPPGERT